jgi:hypothetical protein
MKKIFLVLPFVFAGCSFNSVNTASMKIKAFTKCYVHKLPAPFWVCYETSFMSVGKIHTKKVSRLSQQEAYAVGMKNLSEKILIKTKEFIKKLNVKNDKDILANVKSFVITNAISDGFWYDEKTNILYVKVVINKDEFKNFLFNELKGYDKKVLEVAFNESF